MNSRIASLAIFTTVLGLVSSSPAQAGLILQPTAASTNMGSFTGQPIRTIDQSGLSTGYTSLVTDFDAYFASNPTHNIGFSPPNGWGSSVTVTSGNFDFDLGGTYTIESFALWNEGGDLAGNIVGFTLLAADNAAFNNASVLGSFTANPNTGPATAALPEVFTFAATAASFVRMQITSTNANPGQSNAVLGEAAFEVSTTAVPEPSSMSLLATAGAIGLVGAWRRRRLARS